ncbi:hypothetical protein [Paenibacillus motobuensis]|uniref:Uncharacterized protein n=1 Tax=Paenibacillus motobuensis TaxID=295324 RepID=A0ABN0Y2P8_9BACL
MSSVILDDIQLLRESKSYIDSLYAILTAAGRFQGPKYMLSGLTGMAFKLSVHERLLAMSVTAYGQWIEVHKPAVKNLGLLSVADAGRTRHPTFRWYQQEAVIAVKQSLDLGLGAIYWIPEFGVIHGYDDADQVFYVQDGRHAESQVVLYDNFGLNFTPFWYYEIFGDDVEITHEEMVLESLRIAIDDWHTPYRTFPDTSIASGKLAYTYLREGLQGGTYDEGGARYIFDAYAVSRTEIRDYLIDVEGCWPELLEARGCYEELSRMIPDMTGCIQMKQGTEQIDSDRVGELVHLLGVAEALEDQAIHYFQAISSRYPDLRRSTPPRWGAHSPR